MKQILQADSSQSELLAPEGRRTSLSWAIANAAVGAMILTACATPYQPNPWWGGRGGYSDKKISDDKFYIESLVNAGTSSDKAFEYWHRRAAELCNGRSYTDDAALSIKRMKNYGGPVGVTHHDWPLVAGTATCKSENQPAVSSEASSESH